MASELGVANYDETVNRNGKMGSRTGVKLSGKWSDEMNHTPNNIEEIAAVIDYIEEHLMEERLDLESIAAAFNYSRYHLHRMFASVTGFPMHTYLMRRRLTEAARRLVFSEEPVLEIALASGYETQRSFSRAFQKYFKHSPSQYRKKGDFFPLQLKYDTSRREKLRGGQDTRGSHDGGEDDIHRRLLRFHKGRFLCNRQVLEAASCKKGPYLRPRGRGISDWGK